MGLIMDNEEINNCKYCMDDSEILLQQDNLIDPFSWGWGTDGIKINRSECHEYSLSVFIDREHLRLVDITDSGCLDHGESIKINYCPMCGRKLSDNN